MLNHQLPQQCNSFSTMYNSPPAKGNATACACPAAGGGKASDRRSRRTVLSEADISRVKNELRMRNKYDFNMCRATNVLICGASRSGKTNLFKLLADPAFCPEAGTGLFSDTVSMTLRTFSLTNKVDGAVHEVVINLIDTPGTFEMKSNKEQFKQRSNEEIKNLIVNCINNEICYLNMLVLAINAMKFSSQEIESVKLFLDLFGQCDIPIVLCLTHADHFNAAKRESAAHCFTHLRPEFDHSLAQARAGWQPFAAVALADIA